MTRKNQLGQNITAERASWSFAGDVPQTFVDHIRQSVPGYDEGHELICKLSDFFLTSSGNAYEIGCSTGQLLKKMAIHKKSRTDVKWIGIDPVQEMVTEARKYCSDIKNVEVLCEDARNFAFEDTNLIVAYYSIQFISPKDRQKVYNSIFNALHWGGALIVFEKVRGPDARFQDIVTNLYNNFKMDNGFSSDEIFAKSESLKGILEPFSTKGNLEMFERAGFRDVMTVYKNICFEGFVCIK